MDKLRSHEMLSRTTDNDRGAMLRRARGRERPRERPAAQSQPYENKVKKDGVKLGIATFFPAG